MPDTTLPAEVQAQQRQESRYLVPATPNMLFDPEAFAHGQRVANLFANSQLVPQHLRGKVADCFIALHMAERLGEDPLIVMQNIIVVNGKAGWLTQYMIGRANRSPTFKGRINWRSEGQGDSLKVTAYATLADTGEEVTAMASMAMAKAEGWTSNKKYASMPEHMLRWRSATMLIRLFCPEVMLGIPAADELEDVQSGQMRDVTPARPTRASTRRLMAEEAADPTPAGTAVQAEPEQQPAEEAQAEPAAEEEPQQEPAPAFVLITCDGEELTWEDPDDAKSVFEQLQAQIKDATGRGGEALPGLMETNAALVKQLADAGLSLAAEKKGTAPKAAMQVQDPLDIPPALDRRPGAGAAKQSGTKMPF